MTKKGFTIIEVLVSIAVISIILSSIYWWVILLTNNIEKTNKQIAAMWLAVWWVDLFNAYKKNLYNLNKEDNWHNLLNTTWTWYYIFSWWTLNLSKVPDHNINNYANWEWPLDENWKLKSNNNWYSFYRLLKISDFEVTWKNKTIFDITKNTNIYGESNGININNISYPFLEKIEKTSSWANLIFTENFNIYNKNIIYIWFLDKYSVDNLVISSTVSNTSVNYSSWIYWKWASIDFSSTININPWDIINIKCNKDYIFKFEWTLSEGDINVNIWENIDETLFNFINAANKNIEKCKLYTFAINKYNINEKFNLFNKTNSILNKETINNITINSNVISINFTDADIMWLFLDDYINPSHNLRFFTWATSPSYNDFYNLITDKTGWIWTNINKKWISNVYKIWTQIAVLKNNKLVFKESLDSYLTDTKN